MDLSAGGFLAAQGRASMWRMFARPVCSHEPTRLTPASVGKTFAATVTAVTPGYTAKQAI